MVGTQHSDVRGVGASALSDGYQVCPFNVSVKTTQLADLRSSKQSLVVPLLWVPSILICPGSFNRRQTVTFKRTIALVRILSRATPLFQNLLTTPLTLRHLCVNASRIVEAISTAIRLLAVLRNEINAAVQAWLVLRFESRFLAQMSYVASVAAIRLRFDCSMLANKLLRAVFTNSWRFNVSLSKFAIVMALAKKGCLTFDFFAAAASAKRSFLHRLTLLCDLTLEYRKKTFYTINNSPFVLVFNGYCDIATGAA